ncbi:unnamed protein product [Ilex paraguariensis]|uniref:Uncharacterized protein n=1 Tax=Ilex paraguariensis TaxID=185542 RepID=A0ABC8RH80_9AQUA
MASREQERGKGEEEEFEICGVATVRVRSGNIIGEEDEDEDEGVEIFLNQLEKMKTKTKWVGGLIKEVVQGRLFDPSFRKCRGNSSLSPSELYTWGRDEGDGRLGLGPSRGPNEVGGLGVPSKVKALPVPVAAVSCGGFFTMALTKEGQLWSWGGKIIMSSGTSTLLLFLAP